LDALVRAYDLLDYAQERYASMDPDNHWVPGARAETFDDDEMTEAFPESPLQLHIAERLRRAHRLLHNPAVKPQP